MKKIKKILSLLLSVFVLVGCLCVSSSAEDSVILGDIDGDGTVSTGDARMVLRMASGIEAEDLTLADVDGDGYVTVEDAIKTLYEATNIGGVIIPDKNGDNFLDDKATNEFIKIIATK